MWGQEPSHRYPSPPACYCPLQHVPLWSLVSALPVTQTVLSLPPTALLSMCLSTSHQPVRSGTDVTSPLKPAMNPQLELKVSSFMLPYEFLLHVHLNYNYLCISCLRHVILSSLGPKNMPHCSSTAPTITLCN